MGAPMAANLLSAGFTVTGFDVRPEARVAFADRGGIAANDLADVRHCDAIIVMVNTDAQARAVITETLHHLRDRPRPVLCMSTILPSTIRALAEHAAAVNVPLLDAPVSGGVIVAQMGALAIMVGGDAALVAEARPALEAMGNAITHVGPLGAGLTVKLVNNMIAISALPLVLEALTIGLKQGLDLDTMIGVIKASSGNTWLTDQWEQVRMFLGFMQHDPAQLDALVATGLKDMRLVETLCAEAGIDAPLLERHIAALEAHGAEGLRALITAVLGAA